MKKKDGKTLVFILSMHLMVVWTLSIWSYSGTASAEAVKKVFRFASNTIPAATEPNYVVMIVAVVFFVGGTVLIRRIINWIL